MKTKLLLWMAVLGLAAVFSTASASEILDNYHGGNGHGYGDVIANAGVHTFDISGMEASLSGGYLTVTVFTNFAGNAGIDPKYTKSGKGIGYGDLFFSNGWTPHGTSPYNDDDAANGNHWTYAFSLDDPLSNSGGTGTVFALPAGTSKNHNPGVLVTDHFMSCSGGCIYRNGQAVAVNPADATATGDTGTWTVGNGSLTFRFSAAGLGLDPASLGLHWTMYCGNDVIEGLDPAAVPEPGSIGLFVFGIALIGVGVARRRKAV